MLTSLLAIALADLAATAGAAHRTPNPLAQPPLLPPPSPPPPMEPPRPPQIPPSVSPYRVGGTAPPPVSPATPPVLLEGSITYDDYPAGSLRRHREGTVATELTIGLNGHVTSCAVRASSGTYGLDGETCELMRHRFRFRPATRAGAPMMTTVPRSVTWRLGRDYPVLAFAPGRMTVVVTTGSGGPADCAERSEGAAFTRFQGLQCGMSDAAVLKPGEVLPSPTPVAVTQQATLWIGSAAPPPAYDATWSEDSTLSVDPAGRVSACFASPTRGMIPPVVRVAYYPPCNLMGLGRWFAPSPNGGTIHVRFSIYVRPVTRARRP